MLTPEIGTPIDQLDTPCVIVDLDVMDNNIKTLMDIAKKAGVNVRPHLKSAKSPGFARILIEAGAIGICVAKLSEAEVMVEAGIDDILITTEIVGEPKVSRLVSLATRIPKLKIVIDSEIAANQINDAMKKVDHPLQVLIDVNVGQNRCGVENKDAALSLANAIKNCRRLHLVGVQGYEGHLQMLANEEERKRLCQEAMKKLVDIADCLKQNGFEINTVTTGGTGTYEYCAAAKGVSEVQPGSFMFMDSSYANAGKKDFKQALHVMATVISKPTPNRAVVDAGLKSLSTDSGNAKPSEKWPGIAYTPGGDEHGILSPSFGGELNVEIGEKMLFVPSHIDTTINLHDNYYCVRDNKLESVRKVSARGKVM